jgi:hypothetical protein
LLVLRQPSTRVGFLRKQSASEPFWENKHPD